MARKFALSLVAALMSATLPGNLTQDFFAAPVVESLGRAWPVETRYLGYDSKLRLEDQVAAAIRKALYEEDGSILAFLPGVAEITLWVYPSVAKFLA